MQPPSSSPRPATLTTRTPQKADRDVLPSAHHPQTRHARREECRRTFPPFLFSPVLSFEPGKKKDAAVELRKHTATLERVVINAGVLLGAGRIEDLKSSDLLENLKTNVVGPHNVTKAFAPFVLASKAEGRILSYMSSGGALISEVQKIST